MSATIPQSHLDLITGPVYAVFTTIAPNGQPENTVVWCSWDGEHVLVNSAARRRKNANVRHNPRVALTAMDPNDPFRWLDVRGFVEKIVPDKDYANINAHSLLYDGNPDYFGGRSTEEREILMIRPVRVFAFPRTH
jgi:PPOX class probable F420-dependent enzyme